MVSTGFSRDTYTYGRIGAARPFTVIGLSRILKFFLPSLQNENNINGYGGEKNERRREERGVGERRGEERRGEERRVGERGEGRVENTGRFLHFTLI